ncbi:MAG: hypothetical protein K0S32_2774 [Bacteroidetes bacterium]|jgi:hypothetical protein|nr:hypothetical protein [Bacteroidota bacterium]
MIVERIKSFAGKVNRPLDALFGKFSISNKKMATLFRFAVFFAALHLLFVTIGVYKFMENRPSSVHAFSQSLRASVAQNYYKTDMNFFVPRIQCYSIGDGVTGLEFPIVYYAAAVMYKLFGFNDVFLKLISLVIVVFGLFCFYRLCLKYIQNSILTVFMVGSAVLSPVFLYYTPNYLPDAPSLGFVLASWYFFFQYLGSGRNKDLNFFILFGTLGALIKSVALMAFMVVICLVVLDAMKFFKKTEKGRLFENKRKVLLRIFIGFMFVFAWYFYARYLSMKHGNETFAMKPLMVDSWEALMRVWNNQVKYWGLQYFSYETYVLMAAYLIVIILSARFANRLLFSITVLYTLGSGCYYYFFTYQFEHHDYYIIAMLPCVFFLFLTAGDIAYRLTINYFRPVALILLVVLFFNMKESVINCKTSYYNRNLYENEYLTGIDLRPYHDLEPVMRAKGIKRTDRVMNAFDNTYFSSMYLMDQAGINISDDDPRDSVEKFLKMPDIKYLVLNDSAKFNQRFQKNFSDKIIGYHRGLIIYKLR